MTKIRLGIWAAAMGGRKALFILTLLTIPVFILLMCSAPVSADTGVVLSGLKTGRDLNQHSPKKAEKCLEEETTVSFPLFIIRDNDRINRKAAYYIKRGCSPSFTPEKAVYFSLGRPEVSPNETIMEGPRSRRPGAFARLVLLRPSAHPELTGADRQDSNLLRERIRHLIGKSSEGSRNIHPTDSQVVYGGLYKDFNIKLYGHGDQIEFGVAERRNTHSDRAGLTTITGKDFQLNTISTQTIGGVEAEGNLKIDIYDNGDMAVYRYSNSYWQQQWYGGNCKSTLCYIDGTNYAGINSDGYYSYYIDWFYTGETPLTTLRTESNTIISTDTAELVLKKDDVVSITQTIYYPPGAAYFTLQWEITNLSDSTVNDLRFFSGGDTYSSGIDAGAGYWEAIENTVGVYNMITATLQQNMYMQGNTIPYAYESRNYDDVGESVVANALTNAIDPNEGTDNGMALEWRKESLAAGATWIINATEKFITKEVTTLLVSAPISGQVDPGGSIDLTYSVTNLTDTETIVTLNETIDLGGWTAVIQSPSSPFTLAGNASQDVIILVTCPGGTALGTVAKVTLEATNDGGTASDFCDVEAAQVPTITSHPSDCSVGVGESSSFTISADNATSYQWQEFADSWRNVTNEGIYNGATSTTLNISSAAVEMNGYKYRCVATNDYGNSTSNIATLTVTVSPFPEIHGFSPTSGKAGTLVTITGAHFAGTTSVKFGDSQASFQEDSETQITATVGNGSTGKITVITDRGTAISAGTFTFLGPHFITPEPSGKAIQGVTGRQYTFVAEAQNADGSCTGLTYALVDPPEGATIENFTEGGCNKGRVVFLPTQTRDYTIKITVSDGTDTTPFEPFTVTVSNKLNITPEGHAFFRETGKELQREFTVSGGTPITGSSYYALDILADGKDPETHQTGDNFKYTFDTASRDNCAYTIKVKDKWGFDVTADVTVKTIVVTVKGSKSVTDGSQGATLTVNGGSTYVSERSLSANLEVSPGSPYDGTVINVPAGAAPAGPLNLSLSTVDSGAPFVSATELRGGVVSIKATDDIGNDVSFSSPATVTIPYANLKEAGDNPDDLRVIRYNETGLGWEGVPDVTIDTAQETLSFPADKFSLFGVVIPSLFSFTISGGDEPQQYRMISFPGEELVRNVRDNLQRVFGRYDDTVWRLFAYDALADQYVEATDGNIARFDNEFRLKPGRGYWLISIATRDPLVKGLEYYPNAVFYTVLKPGWNIFSHPWGTDVSVATHDIEVSGDRNTWVGIETAGNDLTEDTFRRFKGEGGSPGNWYETIYFSTGSLEPYNSYWLKNLKDYPVFLRMVKQQTAKRSIPGVPDHLKAFALNWLNKGFSIPAAPCYADTADESQPPDPPTLQGTSENPIGVATEGGGGGGGCFISTVDSGL